MTSKYQIIGLAPSWTHYLNTQVLQISHDCQLKCLNCPHQNRITEPITDISTQIQRICQNKTRLSGVCHIIGGDPVTAAINPSILAPLKRAKYHVVLWTTGLFDSDIWEKYIPYIDHVCLYTPAISPDVLQEITGYYPFIPLESTLSYLQELEIPFTLNHAMHMDSLSELPDLYDLAFEYKAQLLIHHHEKERFDPESRAYIKRFKNIPRVMVFTQTVIDPIQCLGFPFHQKPGLIASIRDSIQLIFYHLKQWGDPQFFLKKHFG